MCFESTVDDHLVTLTVVAAAQVKTQFAFTSREPDALKR
jgi:hypothetical protein